MITTVTPADVYDLTGASVDAADVARARSIIELHASVDLSDFSGFNARDRFWIFKAIAYQAGWIQGQPDYFTRTDFANQAQDGLSFTTRDETSLALGPLARKALRRLSWVRPRTVQVLPSRQLALFELPPGGVAYPPGTPITDEMIFGDDD